MTRERECSLRRAWANPHNSTSSFLPNWESSAGSRLTLVVYCAHHSPRSTQWPREEMARAFWDQRIYKMQGGRSSWSLFTLREMSSILNSLTSKYHRRAKSFGSIFLLDPNLFYCSSKFTPAMERAKVALSQERWATGIRELNYAFRHIRSHNDKLEIARLRYQAHFKVRLTSLIGEVLHSSCTRLERIQSGGQLGRDGKRLTNRIRDGLYRRAGSWPVRIRCNTSWFTQFV